MKLIFKLSEHYEEIIIFFRWDEPSLTKYLLTLLYSFNLILTCFYILSLILDIETFKSNLEISC
jgi:hypothetical protein